MPTLTSWCPFATRTEYPRYSTGRYTDTEHYKPVWHKTQGYDNVLTAVYPKTGSIPKMTILSTGELHQHYSMNRYDRGLRNQSGGVQTNLDGAISIEMVGFVGRGSTKAQRKMMTRLTAWFTAQGIKTGWLNGPPIAGRTPPRLSQKAWDDGSGHCGHIDVPENNHTDPKFLAGEIAAIEAGWTQGASEAMTAREDWNKLYNQADPKVSNGVVEEVQDFLKYAALGPDGKIKRYYGYTTDGKRAEMTDRALQRWKIERWGNPNASSHLGNRAWDEINRQLFNVHVQDPAALPPPTDCSLIEAELDDAQQEVAVCQAQRVKCASDLRKREAQIEGALASLVTEP